MRENNKMYIHEFSIENGYRCYEEECPSIDCEGKVFRGVNGNYFIYERSNIMPKEFAARIKELVENKIDKLKEITKELNQELDMFQDTLIECNKVNDIEECYEEYVETNIGPIPLEEYYDIMAIQNGFDDYEDMKENGYSIPKPETIKEKIDINEEYEER